MTIIKMNESTRKVVTGALFVTLIFALLITMVPQPVLAADSAQTSCVTKHTVKSGETVSSIAVSYGLTWQEVAEANNLKDPYTIYVGQVLCIPEGATTTPDEPTDGSSSDTVSGPRFTLSGDGVYLNIKTVDYPKQQSHIVRVGKIAQRIAFIEMEVISRFRTDENGSSDAYIRLPKEYRDSVLLVCLKNAFTDKTQCNYYDPFE